MGFLKTIAVSTDNYQILKNMGRAGDSFNDVITHLIKKIGALDEQWKTITTTV
jgi:predicted CopG family antitoxin